MSAAVVFLALATTALAKTVTLDWDIGWVTASPDGYARPVMGINGQWPCPQVDAENGDTVVINVKNSLGNETTGLHWHGQYQQGSNHMDGIPGITQCAIPPGESYTYSFTANPGGTSWFHSHDKAQYPDGLRGPFIVHDRAAESRIGFDAETTLTVSDWYHTQTPYLVHTLLGTSNGAMAVMRPDASLINDAMTTTVNIQPGQKLLIRVISMSALMPHVLQFEGHNLTIVAIDGIDVVPTPVEAITIAAGQRYDVLLEGMKTPTRNYAILSKTLDMNLYNNAVLSYSSNFPTPQPLPVGNYGYSNMIKFAVDSNIATVDDFALTPIDQQPLLGPVDHQIKFNVHYTEGTNGGARMTLGDRYYIPPIVPSIFTAMTTGQDAFNPDIYGAATAPYVINSGDVVEFVVENQDGWEHPMHLHGHSVQVVARGYGAWDGKQGDLPAVPMKRDTVTTYPGGHLVLRFKADNPGVWVFHCHMEWHVAAGMFATIIEAPDVMQKTLTIPQPHLDMCKVQDIPTSGNCAGNTENVKDTSQCRNSEDPNEAWGPLVVPRPTRAMATAVPNYTGPANPYPTNRGRNRQSHRAGRPGNRDDPERRTGPSPRRRVRLADAIPDQL